MTSDSTNPQHVDVPWKKERERERERGLDEGKKPYWRTAESPKPKSKKNKN
jgi:hypothetical protein